MPKNAKVSIIVPCYNQAQFLDECLTSVTMQTYADWECIIVDDGSPDNTGEVSSKWVQRDPRIKYFRIANSGVSAARNYGIRQSSGEWILPLDADDKIANNYLALASRYFLSQAKIIYGQAEHFGTVNKRWHLETYSFDVLCAGNIIYVSAFFRKSDFNSSPGYDESLRNGLEDWDFWLSMVNPEDKVVCMKEIVFYYRIKETSRNREVHLAKSLYEDTVQYIYKKHWHKITDHFGSYIDLIKRLSHIKNENDILKKVINSKKYKLFSVFTNFFAKLNHPK